MSRRFIIAALLFMLHEVMCAQPADIRKIYRIEGENIVLNLDRSWPRETQQSILEQCGMKSLSLDTLWKFGNLGAMAKDGWKLTSTKTGYKIYKSVSDLSGDLKWANEVVVFSNVWEKLQEQTRASFGYNSFKKPTVFALKNGGRRFYLEGHTESRDVYLSGTFNNWSTLRTSMTKTDSGWVADVILKPGKHCYKFIVDGRWMRDPQNVRSEDDYMGGSNSVYFMTNHEFRLKGYDHAREIMVTGSFNNWKERELRMKKTTEGWRLQVYLQDGTYGYKFIVDKNWITDPENPEVRDDGKGNKNSYLQLGSTLYFRLDGFTSAQRVIVAGEFNGWDEHELSMKRTSSGWELPYVLAPGNYQYKYIVNGQWITDPTNPHIGSLKGHQNSVLFVKPNHTFILSGYTSARSCELSGNFNGWTGYTLKKNPGGWEISTYLPPGKYLYKFVIDGQWIIDPANELWEQNEHGTGNSVLWISPQ